MIRFFLTTFFLLVTFLAQAQLGIKAGVNIADISELETSKKTDFYAGLVLDIKISDKYTLAPEIQYSKQGATLKEDNNNLQGTTNSIKLEYLSIGIINKFQVAKRVKFQFGPSIELRVYENMVRNENFIELPHFDLCFTGGFGFDVTPNLCLEARYKQGIVDVLDYRDLFDVETGDNNYETRNLNELFQLGIVYTFEFK